MGPFPSLFLSLGRALRRLPWKKIYLFSKKALLTYLTHLKVRLASALATSIHQFDKHFDELTYKFALEAGKRLFRDEYSFIAFMRTVRSMGTELFASRIHILKLMIGAICVFFSRSYAATFHESHVQDVCRSLYFFFA